LNAHYLFANANNSTVTVAKMLPWTFPTRFWYDLWWEGAKLR